MSEILSSISLLHQASVEVATADSPGLFGLVELVVECFADFVVRPLYFHHLH